MDIVEKDIELHKEEYERLTKLLSKILNQINDKYVVWFQHRLKSSKSLWEKIHIRKIKKIKDIIGFRIIYPWTIGLKDIAEILKNCNDLNIFKIKLTERDKVIYLFGKTNIDTIYEIQLWPTIIYTCFEYEHDKIYKPSDPLFFEKNIQKSNELRVREHELQNIIDNNILVPYDDKK